MAGLLRDRAIRARRAGRARDRAIAGTRTRARQRNSAAGAAQIGSGGAQAGGDISSRYRGVAGARSEIHQGAGETIRLRQAGLGAVPDPGARLFDLQFRQELLSRRAGARADQGEAAGLDLARPVDDVDLLCHLRFRSASARRCKDGSRFDIGPPALVIFGYAIPSFLFAVLLVRCSAAARSGRSFRCAGSLPTISPISTGRTRSSIISGTSRCR